MVLQCVQSGGKSLNQLPPKLAFTLPFAQVETFFVAPQSSDWMFAGLIAACFSLLIASAEIWHRTKKPPVEWTRKLLHFSGGIVSLSLPMLIHSHWVVLCLAMSMGAIFVVSKKNRWLQSIHGIDRVSSGSEFYPVVIYICFVLCNGVVWKFVICILILAISDSAAALIGKKFGQLVFRVEEEHKSVAGCLAFFIVTFVSALIPLLIWDPLAGSGHLPNVWHYVLTASLIGLLVMCIELISLGGADNLWIPLGTLLVLTKTMQTDVYDLAIQNFSFATLLALVIVVAHISKAFNAGGSIVFCLSSYGCWAMGSFDWALPIFIGYAIYLTMSYVAEAPWKLRVRSVLYNVLAPFLFMASANLFLNIQRVDLYQFLFVPFLTAVCVSLTQACSNIVGWKFRSNLSRRVILTAGLAPIIALAIHLPAVYRNELMIWSSMIWVLLVTVGFSIVSCLIVRPLPPGDAPPSWLYLRSGLALLAGLTMILIQFLKLVDVANVL